MFRNPLYSLDLRSNPAFVMGCLIKQFEIRLAVYILETINVCDKSTFCLLLPNGEPSSNSEPGVALCSCYLGYLGFALNCVNVKSHRH